MRKRERVRERERERHRERERKRERELVGFHTYLKRRERDSNTGPHKGETRCGD